MFDIYLINIYWEDEDMTVSDLFLSLERVWEEKDKAFREGAAQVSVYAFQTDGNCLIRVGPIFNGKSPSIEEEPDEYPESAVELEMMKREKPLMTMEEIFHMYGIYEEEDDDDEVS